MGGFWVTVETDPYTIENAPDRDRSAASLTHLPLLAATRRATVAHFCAMFVRLGEFLDAFTDWTFGVVAAFCAPMTDSSIVRAFPPEDTLALATRTPG